MEFRLLYKLWVRDQFDFSMLDEIGVVFSNRALPTVFKEQSIVLMIACDVWSFHGATLADDSVPGTESVLVAYNV